MRSIHTYSFLLSVLFYSGCYSQAPGSLHYSTQMLLDSVLSTGPITFCNEPMPLEKTEIREQFEKELLLLTWDKPQIILWLKRSTRYFPVIESILKHHNLPDDIKYVAVIESALQPHANSNKTAVGFWQFIQSTGEKYGLKINEDIDERRNILYSTQAAARYFITLYDSVGSWTLAAAAYNMGEFGMLTEMLIQNCTDYYQLQIPLETQRFIFRIIAIKLLLTNPDKFGLRMESSDFYPVQNFDRVILQVDSRIPLQVIALAANTTFKTIKNLNPELIGYYVPQGTRAFNVPSGTGLQFNLKLDSTVQKWKIWQSNHSYMVREGDSLSKIARQFGVTQRAIIIWNDLSHSDQLKPGMKLVVTPFSLQ